MNSCTYIDILVNISLDFPMQYQLILLGILNHVHHMYICNYIQASWGLGCLCDYYHLFKLKSEIYTLRETIFCFNSVKSTADPHLSKLTVTRVCSDDLKVWIIETHTLTCSNTL